MKIYMENRMVDNYMIYCEEDLIPSLQKTIKTLIYKDEESIVFIDDKNTIQWDSKNIYIEDSTDSFGLVINRVSYLEEVSKNIVDKENIVSIKILLAESIARILSDKNKKNALIILNQVESIITEKLKKHYLLGSFFSLLFFLVLNAIIYFSVYNQGIFINKFIEYLFYSGFGSLGAFISIYSNSNKFKANYSFNNWSYFFNGIFRNIYGYLIAFVIIIAIKSNIILSPLSQNCNIYFYIFCSIFAGYSEGILPQIFKKIESGIKEDY